MDTVLGWFTAMLPLAMAALLLGSVLCARRTGSRHVSSGVVSGFDEIWAPGAAEARAIWETEQELPLEIPSPDGDDRADRDFTSGRITITPR